MLPLGAAVVGVIVGVVAYGWLFANRSPGRRLAYAVTLAVAVPVVLFALLAGLVAVTFMLGE